MGDLNPGQDNFQLSWYTEPHYTIILLNEDGSSSTVVGTFRSHKCKRVAECERFKNQCTHCSDIPKQPSFRKRCILRTERTEIDQEDRSIHIRNDFMTRKEMMSKLTHQEEKLSITKSQLFFMSTKNIRL